MFKLRNFIEGIASPFGSVLHMGDRTYGFDANLQLSDGAAAYTASGYSQVGGAQAIVDTGGNQNVTVTLPSIAASATMTPQQARIDAAIALWITGIYTGGANSYKLLVLVSNDPSFGAGNVEIAGALEFGTAGSTDVPNGITTPAPSSIGGDMYEILFSTEQNSIKHQYVALYNVIAGTTPTITYKAFMAILPCE